MFLNLFHRVTQQLIQAVLPLLPMKIDQEKTTAEGGCIILVSVPSPSPLLVAGSTAVTFKEKTRILSMLGLPAQDFALGSSHKVGILLISQERHVCMGLNSYVRL